MLKWPSLEQKRKQTRLKNLYKIVNGNRAVEIPNYFRQKERQTRNYHPLKFINAGCRTNIYKYSFFPRSVKEWNELPETIIEAANTEAFKLALRAQARFHWAFEHFLFLYHQHKFTALFLAHIARAQHISSDDGLYCPLQIRHLDLDLFGIRWAPFCLETPKKPSSFPSNQRSVSWYLRYFNNSLNLHQMYQWKTEDSECIAWGSTERFAYTFMYSNTQFRTKNLSIITFRMKKVDSLFLVRLHWRIQNISCTLNVPMFYSSQFPLTFNVQDGGEGSLLAAKIRLLWQAAKYS